MEWISVEDRLPEDGQFVIWYGPNGKAECGTYLVHNGVYPWAWADYEDAHHDDVMVNGSHKDWPSHWMPLPEPPDEH